MVKITRRKKTAVWRRVRPKKAANGRRKRRRKGSSESSDEEDDSSHQSEDCSLEDVYEQDWAAAAGLTKKDGNLGRGRVGDGADVFGMTESPAQQFDMTKSPPEEEEEMDELAKLFDTCRVEERLSELDERRLSELQARTASLVKASNRTKEDVKAFWLDIGGAERKDTMHGAVDCIWYVLGHGCCTVLVHKTLKVLNSTPAWKLIDPTQAIWKELLLCVLGLIHRLKEDAVADELNSLRSKVIGLEKEVKRKRSRSRSPVPDSISASKFMGKEAFMRDLADLVSKKELVQAREFVEKHWETTLDGPALNVRGCGGISSEHKKRAVEAIIALLQSREISASTARADLALLKTLSPGRLRRDKQWIAPLLELSVIADQMSKDKVCALQAATFDLQNGFAQVWRDRGPTQALAKKVGELEIGLAQVASQQFKANFPKPVEQKMAFSGIPVMLPEHDVVFRNAALLIRAAIRRDQRGTFLDVTVQNTHREACRKFRLHLTENVAGLSGQHEMQEVGVGKIVSAVVPLRRLKPMVTKSAGCTLEVHFQTKQSGGGLFHVALTSAVVLDAEQFPDDVWKSSANGWTALRAAAQRFERTKKLTIGVAKFLALVDKASLALRRFGFVPTSQPMSFVARCATYVVLLKINVRVAAKTNTTFSLEFRTDAAHHIADVVMKDFDQFIAEL